MPWPRNTDSSYPKSHVQHGNIFMKLNQIHTSNTWWDIRELTPSKAGHLCCQPRCSLMTLLLSSRHERSGQSIHLKTFHSLDTRMLGQTEMGKEWLFRELKAAQDKLFLGSGPATWQPLQSPKISPGDQARRRFGGKVLFFPGTLTQTVKKRKWQ